MRPSPSQDDGGHRHRRGPRPAPRRLRRERRRGRRRRDRVRALSCAPGELQDGDERHVTFDVDAPAVGNATRAAGEAEDHGTGAEAGPATGRARFTAARRRPIEPAIDTGRLHLSAPATGLALT
jgi:hypothetical protein